jgi:hypothetical protein
MKKYMHFQIFLTGCIYAFVKYANISCQNIFFPSFSVVEGAGGDFIEFTYWHIQVSQQTYPHCKDTLFETNIPRKGIARSQSPNFRIHVSVSDLYIPTIGLPILVQENMWTDPGKI